MQADSEMDRLSLCNQLQTFFSLLQGSQYIQTMGHDEISFKEKLEKAHSFPDAYIFKFIVKSEFQNEVECLVDDADITVKSSSGNKYISVTVVARMNSSTEVIEVYKRAKEIDGIISL